MFSSGDDIGALVGDIGSFSSRVGFAGDDLPRSHISTSFGCSSDGKKYFDYMNNRDGVSLVSPLSDGLIDDWDAFELLWRHIISKNLKSDTSESPVLLSEKSYNPSSTRQKLCEIMFETFRTPAFFLSKDSVLSCYACGRTSGLAVDFGYNATVLTPVIDGWVDLKGFNKSNIGGNLLDRFSLSLMQQKNPPSVLLYSSNHSNTLIDTSSSSSTASASLSSSNTPIFTTMALDIARNIKESTCRVSDTSFSDSDSRYANIPLMPYELPDGTVLDLGIERFKIPEIIFDPQRAECVSMDVHLAGGGGGPGDYLSIPSLICDSIYKSDVESQATLLSNLVLTGGSSKFDGLPERIKLEVENIMHLRPVSAKVKIVASNTNERSICTWLGGSILASLGQFHDMWITKQEYAEYGASIIDKKCP